MFLSTIAREHDLLMSAYSIIATVTMKRPFSKKLLELGPEMDGKTKKSKNQSKGMIKNKRRRKNKSVKKLVNFKKGKNSNSKVAGFSSKVINLRKKRTAKLPILDGSEQENSLDGFQVIVNAHSSSLSASKTDKRILSNKEITYDAP